MSSFRLLGSLLLCTALCAWASLATAQQAPTPAVAEVKAPSVPSVPTIKAPNTPNIDPGFKTPAPKAVKRTYKAPKKSTRLASAKQPTKSAQAKPTDDAPPAEAVESSETEAANTAAAPPVEPAPAPAQPPEPSPQRDWLAPQRDEPVAAASSGGFSSALALFVLIAIAGVGLWFQKNRKKKSVEQRLGGTQLNVLANTRIGPKAHAVAVEFGDRVMLLGVTESNVSCLQSFDRMDTPLDNPSPSEERNGRIDGASPAAFRAYLDTSLSRGSQSAAEQLADATSDRPNIQASRRQEFVDVEGQAAGLAARLKKKTAQL